MNPDPPCQRLITSSGRVGPSPRWPCHPIERHRLEPPLQGLRQGPPSLGKGSMERSGGELKERGQSDDHTKDRQSQQDQDADNFEPQRQRMTQGAHPRAGPNALGDRGQPASPGDPQWLRVQPGQASGRYGRPPGSDPDTRGAARARRIGEGQAESPARTPSATAQHPAGRNGPQVRFGLTPWA